MASSILEVCSLITSIAAVMALLVKPLREKLFGLNDIREGQKCMLRAEMLSIYYEGKDSGDRIRQHKMENFILMYSAYKAMGGNSFVDKINKEVLQMEVIS